MRDAIGPDIDLLVDANNAYVQADAVRMARILEEYDAFWFEEPVLARQHARQRGDGPRLNRAGSCG